MFAYHFLHEFCHYLKRNPPSTLGDSRMNKTPESFSQNFLTPVRVSAFSSEEIKNINLLLENLPETSPETLQACYNVLSTGTKVAEKKTY
jgi:hypothetical protein